MHDQLTLRGISDTPVQAASRSAPSAAQTLLKELVRERHLTYEAFSADYKKAASEVTADGTAPSRAQYYRWLSGQLKRGMPYPGACRVLEAMFAPWRAADLFGPYQPGRHAPHFLERAVSDQAAFGQFTAQQPVTSRGP